MTSEQKQKLRRLKNDFSYYSEKLLKIRTKAGKLTKFKVNAMQQKIDVTIEKLKSENKPVRIIILKYRQGGASTYSEGKIFQSTTMNKMMNSLIVAHEEDASTNLFNMSKLFYDELPEGLKPMRKASNAKELVFENPTLNSEEKKKNPGLRSKIKIASANNLGAGRSSTIHNLHASEVAFWRDASRTMLALMQAVPNSPNTMVILESTADGVGGYYYDEWQRAKNGESDFVALFFAWFEEPEYRMPAPEGFELTQDELELKKLYNLDDEQLVWRRWCISNNCGGDAELFKQEYPSNDIEAFLVSGRPRFDIPTLMQYLDQCVDGERGNLERHGSEIKFIPDPKGYIEIWERPKESKMYGIGGDPARGLITGDYSTGPVYDENENMVALWHGHMDPDLFADQLELLGLYYKEAVMAIEENNHGLAVLNRLKESYYNLYKRTTHDKATDTEKEQLGWWTSEKTKALAIDNLARLIRTRQLGTKSKRFIQECLTYVREDNGSTNAQQGSNDDIVMASAIILYVMPNYVMPVQSIIAPITAIQESDGFSWVGNRHRSEIEDEQKEEEDGFLNRWGGI